MNISHWELERLGLWWHVHSIGVLKVHSVVATTVWWSVIDLFHARHSGGVLACGFFLDDSEWYHNFRSLAEVVFDCAFADLSVCGRRRLLQGASELHEVLLTKQRKVTASSNFHSYTSFDLT